VSVRILQFGTTGQVATEMRRQAGGHDVSLKALSRSDADLTNPEACAAAVELERPDLVVIAAAYTAVDAAETDRETADRINVECPAAIAQAAGHNGAAVVHFSTDYVFDGTKPEPYVEDDPIHPVSAYGRSKLEGERAVWVGNPRALILRTSWVISAHGRNFVKTMLRLAAEGQPIRVVDDQWGRPTAAADLAGFVLANAGRLARAESGDPAFGVTHFANAGETTWRRLAEATFELALGEAAPPVSPIPTADYPTPARRPARGVLDTTRLETVFGYTPRPWREALAEIVADLKVNS
jgi:dTDP-4-dehydrorhamnose reductase